MIRLFYVVLFLFSFSTLAEFDWQGHRGARGLYPENTINGMKEAMNFPISTLEMDVVISKDEKVVVSHEPWIGEEACLDPKGKTVKDREINLYQLNYAEIKAYDCGSKQHPRFLQQKKIVEHKPLLSDLITALEPSKYNYNIEIKSTLEDEQAGFQPEYKRFSNLVVAEITKHLPLTRFTVQSFDWRVLKYLHEKYPQIKLVALRETKYIPKQVLEELGFAPAIFSPDFRMLSKDDVNFFHAKKIKVIPWTVNTIEDMKRIISMGVDGIITDYPNLILEIPKETYLHLSECPKNFNRFEGRCVRVPKNAIPSLQNPGWDCRSGYVQKRDSCIKMKIPKNAVLNEDGKTWTCGPGFKRYRARCNKI